MVLPSSVAVLVPWTAWQARSSNCSMVSIIQW